MDEEAFRDYVISECNDQGIDLRQLCEEQHTFAKEALHFLRHNAHLWIEYPANFLLQHRDGEKYTLFTCLIGDAVVTNAFMKRIEFKHVMIPKLHELASPECYKRLIMEYPVTKNGYYFYNYLEWISFIFSLTIFCYKEGYDYFELGQQCLVEYSEVLYFHRLGGWVILNQAAHYVTVIGVLFWTAINQQEHAEKNIVRVLKARRKHERRYRYETNKWTTLHSGVLTASDVREKMSAKFRVASALNSRRVVSGYKVLINNELSDMLKRNKGDCSDKDEKTFATETRYKVSSESEEAVAEIASRLDLTKISDRKGHFQVTNITDCTEIENTSGGIITCDERTQTEPLTSSVSRDGSFNSTKTSDRKGLFEIISVTDYTESENTSGRIVTCDERTQNEPLASSVSRDGSFNSAFEMDKNIVFVISQRLLRNTQAAVDRDYIRQRGIKVCSPSMNRDFLIGNIEILHKNIKNKNFRRIADEVLVVCPPGCDYEDEDSTVMVLDTSTEDEDDDEFNAGKLCFKNFVYPEPPTCFNIPECGLRVSPSLSRNSRDGSWSLTESGEQRRFLPTRSTGAIPKVKTSIQPETECHATEDLEISKLTLTSNLGGETGRASSTGQMESTSDLLDQQQIEHHPSEARQGLQPDVQDSNLLDANKDSSEPEGSSSSKIHESD